MPKLSNQLILDSCPHCGRATPVLVLIGQFLPTQNHQGSEMRFWGIYYCTTCGGIITAGGRRTSSDPKQTFIDEIYPNIPTISDSIPQKARALLRQAQNSLHAPAGAIMLSASALDAMLKEKSYTKGSLNTRIDKAATNHLITTEMAQWAHHVRLDANEQRHADEDVSLPTAKDAKLTFAFAVAFAEYLFVLPSKVSRGISDSGSGD